MYHTMYDKLLNLSARVLERLQLLGEIRLVLKCDSDTSRTIMCNNGLTALKLNAQKMQTVQQWMCSDLNHSLEPAFI